MKITDYPSVDSLTDDDVILIDGNNGTKNLQASYVKRIRDRLDRFEDPLQPGKVVPADNDRNIDTIDKNCSVIANVDDWGVLDTYVDPGTDAKLQIFKGIWNDSVYKRRYNNSQWSEWDRLDPNSRIGQKWVPNENISVNWHRIYNNQWYRCIRRHTSSASLTPTDTTYWTPVTIDNEISSMLTNFQAGVDTLYNACVNKGVTPSSSTPSDIASAIQSLYRFPSFQLVIRDMQSSGSDSALKSVTYTCTGKGIFFGTYAYSNYYGSDGWIRKNGVNMAYDTGPIGITSAIFLVNSGDRVEVKAFGTKRTSSNSSAYIIGYVGYF